MSQPEWMRQREGEHLRSQLEDLRLAREAAEQARDDLLERVGELRALIADKQRALAAAEARVSADDALLSHLRTHGDSGGEV